MALKCTNTSSPSGREMKPYPFSALNHFTVPCGICNSLPSALHLLTRRSVLGGSVLPLRTSKPLAPEPTEGTAGAAECMTLGGALDGNCITPDLGQACSSSVDWCGEGPPSARVKIPP